MQTMSIDPANMTGESGRKIELLDRFMRHTSNQFRQDIPLFDRIVLLSSKADGDHIPKIGHIGEASHINDVMNGRFGSNAAEAIRNQDPEFDRAVAGGYARASGGHPVFEFVELEITPPGFSGARPIVASYHRAIWKMSFYGRPTLVNLTLPCVDFRIPSPQSQPGEGYPLSG